MRTRRSLCGIAVCAVLAAAPRAYAAQECKPVVGSFEAHVVVAGCASPVGLCTAGRVWGGIQGTYAFTMSSAAPTGEPDVPTILFFTGHSTVALKTGDVVLGTDTGVIDLPPGNGGFASLITFNGGTGAMTNATGQIRLRGDFDPVAGTTSGDYLGTICTAT
ncbi:MAG TPA: hypothetical protein VJP86_07220 [Vicinamibacterales bacterium]|nr:hypothetical protein [Vicinamibacterales bacterium]